MPSFDFDLFVIGGGSAGVRLARTAAGYGARVGLAEDADLGGTCVNLGCVPKKLLAYGAHIADELEDAAGFGWTIDAARFDWPTLIHNKDAEIARLNRIYAGLLSSAGVEVRRARARVTGPQEVEVGGSVVRAAHVAVCTGGQPVRLPIPGAELALTSDQLFSLPALPNRLLVLGGGYIAAEFASIFRGFGVDVELVHRGPLFLRGFDDDLRAHLAHEMTKKGVRLRWNAEATAITATPEGLRVDLSDGESALVDQVLMATGRSPNTAGLGLREVGVACTDGGAIRVDEAFYTSVPSILALGDVINRVALTPVALGEAMVVARNLFAGGTLRMDYRDIPTAVFTNPNAAAVGLTEADARALGPVRLFKSTFRPMKHTLSGRDERTFMKLVVDTTTDRVLGCHMVGPDAGELIQGLAVALKCGATKAQFDATIGIHPTAAEEFVTMRTPWTPAPPAAP
jgi:glutathione reductase (NADPH)